MQASENLQFRQSRSPMQFCRRSISPMPPRSADTFSGRSSAPSGKTSENLNLIYGIDNRRFNSSSFILPLCTLLSLSRISVSVCFYYTRFSTTCNTRHDKAPDYLTFFTKIMHCASILQNRIGQRIFRQSIPLLILKISLSSPLSGLLQKVSVKSANT